ncbi:hypothetical protein FRACYDRAFT_254571 [Fragilariopsis cylindrus CCMP1102]|uniref:Auxin efflux carrier n=1 Tax=Fragilariopsis cylindrus CCMP1102 TaxID=635003 RepID=A0A1E7ELH4_9STRA|nr:hypothetical protein FRACYDRAFT_254571 [Fragilariopsis cylindrus CCMP1102]|eukprot:OEU06413.1 hypothetical protein FRACYDRAFT_254571 [Fragilariopsis cylindrus CCMP1102]
MTGSTSIMSSILTQSNNPAVHAAGRATLEIFISSIIGIGCIDYKLINQTTISALSSTTYKILLPMFLGTNIIKTITKTNGLTKSSMTLPLLASLQSFILYMITTKIIFPLLLLLDDGSNIVDSNTIRNSDDGRGISICSSFGNGGVVPLIFCESLFGRSSSSGDNDLLAISTGCVALFLVGWSPFFWGFGRSILLGDDANASSSKDKKTIIANKLKSMLPPPVIGVFIGMIIATIPIIRKLFITNDVGASVSSPLFGVVFDTMQNFGKAASPLSLLVLVSSLALGAGFGSGSTSATTGSTRTGTKSKNESTDTTSSTIVYEIPFWKRWGIVSFMRFIISPIIMYSLLKVVSSPQIGLIDSYKTTDSTYTSMIWFICILESIMPPAQNQVTLLHVANKTDKANEMATFLFFIYTTSMIPLVIILSMALQQFQLI